MQIIRGFKKTSNISKPVAVLGIFDGVHLAHRRLLKEAVKKAHRLRKKSVVITFWPHPQCEHSIYSLEHRLRLIGEEGVHIAIVISFDKKFSEITAEDFIIDILVRKLDVSYVYIGENFKFGRGAKGDYRLLRKLSKIHGFKVKVFKILKINKKPISSSYIRKLITRGKLKEAKQLLSRPVGVLGTVVRGVCLGSRLGFPTANVNPHHEVLPPTGIYAVKVIFENQILNGVCYIGRRATFGKERAGHKGPDITSIEVYIFDFNRNIYGKEIEIYFVKKIREDKRFICAPALIKQIKKDLIIARKLLARFHFTPNICLP